MKSVQIGVFSGPYFPVFGLNAEICKSPYLVRIQENTDQEKLRLWTFFTQWISCIFRLVLLGREIIVIKVIVFKKQKKPFADVLKIGVLKNLAIFKGKHLCWSLFNKVRAFRLQYFNIGILYTIRSYFLHRIH